MKYYPIIFFVLLFFIKSNLTAQETVDQFRYYPFNIGLTYSEKIGLNIEGDIYLPKIYTLEPFRGYYRVNDGPFLCLNFGWNTSGIGLGYGVFIRSMGTVGTNIKVKILYSYRESNYINSGYYYINPELEIILASNCFEFGYLRPVNNENDKRNLLYLGWGVKI